MTRIIGGVAGGRHLKTPPGDRTRPTSDRVREALFSAVESSFGSWHGLAVLDLYAGSGAVGLEAASRGAARVVLVEAHPPTARLIRDNARTLGLDAHVVAAHVGTALGTPPDAPFDVVFADPPYDMETQLEADLVRLGSGGWLAPDAQVIVERSARSMEPSWPEGWTVERTKRYGETVLWYVRALPVEGPQSGEETEGEP
jgi:16S rRNA (guanine966-N2)-methyltransferase